MTYRVTVTLSGIASKAVAHQTRDHLDMMLRQGLPADMTLTAIVGEEGVEDEPQHEHLKEKETNDGIG